MKTKGKIRHLGFSFHGRTPFLRRILDVEKWDAALLLLNALDWKGANNACENLAICRAKGTPVLVMEPLAGGRLARLGPKTMERLSHVDASANAARWGFRFAASQEGVACILSGATRMSYLCENIETLSDSFCKMTVRESGEYLSAVAESMKGGAYVPCAGCNYCLPCPYGIDIPRIFDWWNDRLLTKGLPSCGNGIRDRYECWKFLQDFTAAIAHFRGPEHCTGCRKCESVCPQWQFAISDELMKIDRYVSSLRSMGHTGSRGNLLFQVYSALERFFS